MTRLLVSLAITCSCLFACKTTSQNRKNPYKGLIGTADCFHIINGQKTQAFPEVTLILSLSSAGKIHGICSGTFIGSRTVLTAAHCITSPAIGISRANELGPSQASEASAMSTYVPAMKVLNMDPYASQRTNWSPEYARADIAILIFANPVAPAIAPLMDRKGVPVEDVTLVGFGNTDIDPRRSDPVMAKRFGYNTLAVVPTGLSVVGPPSSVGTQLAKNSTTAPGDSGGPLFVGGKLAGVLSGGGPYSNTLDQSFYADITSDNIKAFIQSAAAQGADIGSTSQLNAGINGLPGQVRNPDCLY